MMTLKEHNVNELTRLELMSGRVPYTHHDVEGMTTEQKIFSNIVRNFYYRSMNVAIDHLEHLDKIIREDNMSA